MNDQRDQPTETLPVGQPQGTDPGFNELLNKILERALQTREARSLLAGAVPVVLKIWAGESGWRRIVSKVAAGTLKKGFSGSFGSGEEALEKLFEDPDFLDSLGELMTGLFTGIEDALITGAQTLERLPPDDKKKFATEKLSRLMPGKTGDMVTNFARIINDIQQNDPEFLSRVLAPAIRKWVASVDFGEVKEAVDGSAQGVVSLVETANDVMWQYPAKVILFLSLLPSLANILGRSTLVSVSKLEETPPDLLTDIVISLVREIDGSMIVGLVNALAEIGRKVHTGSALLGDAGASQLPKLFSEKLEEIIAGTDPVLFWKARIAIAEIKASFDLAMADAVHQDPEHWKQAMLKHPELINIRRQHMNRKLLQFEAMDDGEFAALWTESLAAYDVQETAEILNNFLKMANRLRDQNPEALVDMVSRFSSAIDDDALAETAQHFFEDAGGSFRPVARSVVPGLVTWVCHVLKPEDDAYEEDAARAREALRSLLMPEEV
jgi:hypothetical protein